MVRDAEEHAEADKKRRDLIEAKNSADSAVYGYVCSPHPYLPLCRCLRLVCRVVDSLWCCAFDVFSRAVMLLTGSAATTGDLKLDQLESSSRRKSIAQQSGRDAYSHTRRSTVDVGIQPLRTSLPCSLWCGDFVLTSPAHPPHVSMTFFFLFCWQIRANISTEKNLLEHKDKIPEEVKADVQKAIDELKAVMESEDAEDIKEKVQALQVRSV